MAKLVLDKEIAYYTDNRLGDPLYSLVQKLLKETGLRIVSASLKPIDFGDNEVVEGERGYVTLTKQIVSCLKRVKTKYVFFCEHDVLYPKCHFDFTPKKDDVFYYNANVWRWYLGSEKAVRYERMIPLSVLSVNTEFALDHYEKRLKAIFEKGYDLVKSNEPSWARIWGYEPGTKLKRRGGFSDDTYDTWYSEVPVIDVRHDKTYSPPKVTLESFKHLPNNWEEAPIDHIDGWDLKGIL